MVIYMQELTLEGQNIILKDQKMAIGEKIRSIRNSQKLSVNELSELCGIPEKTIYRIETGEVQDPKISSLKPIIKALNCSADEILFDKDDYYAFGALKQAFASASQLPDEEIEILTTVIAKYCLATQISIHAGKYAAPAKNGEETKNKM